MNSARFFALLYAMVPGLLVIRPHHISQTAFVARTSSLVYPLGKRSLLNSFHC